MHEYPKVTLYTEPLVILFFLFVQSNSFFTSLLYIFTYKYQCSSKRKPGFDSEFLFLMLMLLLGTLSAFYTPIYYVGMKRVNNFLP